MAKKDTSATESQTAPDTEDAKPVESPEAVNETPQTPVAPPPVKQRRVERQGGAAVPYVHKYPEVRGGICEWCGVLDPNLPSEYQYKLCPHFRGQQLRCSYCDETRDPDDIVGHHTLHVYDHPTNPDLQVVVCTSYECTRKHEQRFKTTAR